MPRPIHSALLWPLSLLVGIALFLLTNLVEPAVPATLNFGSDYAQMAQNLTGFVGSFPHRILAPLLARGADEMAHWFGGAVAYWQFAHACTVLFLATLFAGAHLLGAKLWQALLLATVIGFTGAVQLYKGHVGYPEPITFALLLGSVLAVRRPGLFWSLQFLNVMHHEQILFFWPWLCWWRQQHGARWRDDAIGALVVLGLYAGWRYYTGAHAQAPLLLTLDHYLGLKYFPVGTLGLAALNLTGTFIFFGALPVVVVWHAGVGGWRRVGLPLLLFLLGQHAMFGVAHDVYRFTCFLFLPLLFAGLELMSRRGGALVLSALAAVSVGAMVWQRTTFETIAIRVLTDVDGNGVPFVRPDIVGDIVPKVIPALPWTFAAYAAATVLTVVTGLWWARRTRANATAPGSVAG